MAKAVIPRPLMLRRVAATQATVDRFKGRAFRFGSHDCARMVAYHLKQIGRPMRLAKAGTYRSLLGATRALRHLGYDSLAAALDDHGLTRIAPAAAVVGDIVELPGEPPFGALSVAVGNGRVLGFHQDTAGAEILQPTAFVAAWRVL
ncbi:MAG: hypothetical protein Q7J32_11730 [Sphingomonadaceae bacterium]|nr:hypothetical protein [Sphingomonadaceae bacterium]